MPPVRRTTARKSVAPPARKCSMSNSQAASNDESWGSELEKALAFADSQPTVLPAPGGSSVASDAAVKAVTAPDDIALEDERGEGINEARAQEDVALARDNAVSVLSSACSAEMEVSLDETEVRRVDCGFPESGEDNVLDDGGDQVVVNDNGGKEKKVVKKMVEVVKQKVKMKVLKKVPKVRIRETVDSVAENLNPISIERVEIQPVTGSSVQLNHQNSNSGTRPIESCEKDGSDTQVEQVEGNVLMEVDQKGGGYWSETGNRVVQEHTDEGLDVEKDGNGERRHGNEELCGGGDEGAEEQGRNEEVGNVGRLEEEEEKLVSGELEAMESRKRKTEIFISGLDKDAKEEDVRKIFARAGEIVNLTVAKDAETGKKGHAFVRYVTAEEAKKALENFSEVKVCGKHCGAIPVEKNSKIFLGGIDMNQKDKDVSSVPFSNVSSASIEFNHGFALVELETSEDAKIAYKKLQKEDVVGKNRGIRLAWAKTLKEPNGEELLKHPFRVLVSMLDKFLIELLGIEHDPFVFANKIYAVLIPLSWDEEKIKDTFKKFVERDDIVLGKNLQTSRRKDFAFITYETQESAIVYIKSLYRRLNNGDGSKVPLPLSCACPQNL
ncbi:hypothetical protein Cgig2_005911 [Carnegiea gigantea]|uniref:RRM domain-containing protein n=1 Tax=Carnegiea gigantea TaxID=171969 RepID=A0A9Q1Q9S8_9CARY|nr:hypothetical protein Cgig2_005911 [Carnegiea gigantea]